MSQLRQLSEPFPKALVKAPPQGKFGSYVGHSTVNERALSIVGPFSFEVIDVIRGQAHEVVIKKGKPDEKVYPERVAIVGCLAALTLTVDGREIRIVEAGDVEGAAAQEDGANLKEAASDAFKRCWMRTGLGLHLWSQIDYFLDKQLDKDAAPGPLPPIDPTNPERTSEGTGVPMVEIPGELGQVGFLENDPAGDGRSNDLP